MRKTIYKEKEKAKKEGKDGWVGTVFFHYGEAWTTRFFRGEATPYRLGKEEEVLKKLEE